MTYRIEKWTERGISYEEAPTKNEANRIAGLRRAEMSTSKQWGQTIVIFPNGNARICRVIAK